jgi:hypothetical protein
MLILKPNSDICVGGTYSASKGAIGAELAAAGAKGGMGSDLFGTRVISFNI